MLAQIRKINEPIDRAQHVIGWHELVEAKFVKKTLLHHEPIAHHRRISLPPQIERITAKHWSRALFQRNPPIADLSGLLAVAVQEKSTLHSIYMLTSPGLRPLDPEGKEVRI